MVKTAVVTGASGGIGRAVALRLAAAGYGVFAHYRSRPERLEGLDGAIIPIYGDFSSAEGVNAFADALFRETCRVDVLVNNAGAAAQKLYTDCTDGEVEDTLFVDLTAAMLLTKRVVPAMVARKSGCIVNVSSVWGVYGGSCEAAYSAAKGGLIAFTKALARELGLSNIRVNCVAPGFIETEMNSGLSEEDRRAFLDGVALGRAGRAEEIASVIAFLASEDSSYVTGQIIGADGGF